MNSKNLGCWIDRGNRLRGWAECYQLWADIILGSTTLSSNLFREGIRLSPRLRMKVWNAIAFQSIKMRALPSCSRRGDPGPRASRKEGGRILGPLGKSVWSAARLSRVKMNGYAALDSRAALLTKQSVLIRKGGMPFDVVLFCGNEYHFDVIFL